MAGVVKDPRDGQWLARWRDPGGRQRKKSFGRKVDAQRWLDQMRAEGTIGGEQPTAPPNATNWK